MSCDACKTIPPVIAEGYTPKGQYEDIAGLRTYVTGSPEATVGIVDIYDIFGLSSQTIQGADILAARLNAVVLLPDFFKGASAKHEWVPADTEEKQKALMGFISTAASIPDNVAVLSEVTKTYKTKFPSVAKWGAIGLCWGGKVAILSSGPDAFFSVTGQVHPGRMDQADAEKLTIPHIVLASKDEPADVVKAYEEIIGKNGIGGHVETYDKMWHGWMGARANLEGEESRAEYIRGYSQIADYFEKYLK